MNQKSNQTSWAVGFDLGGTNLRAALVSEHGKVRARYSRNTFAERGPDAVIEEIIDLIKEVLKKGHRKVASIGVAAPGPLDPGTGVIIKSPNLKWTNVPLKKCLEDNLNIPVIVDNDSQMTAFGEKWLGAGRGANNLLCLTLGTGVGGGVIFNGHIFHGETGSAGHIGHHILDPNGPKCGCGAHGCLESYVSAPNIVRRTLDAINTNRRATLIPQYVNGDLKRLTAYHIFQAARDQDPLAMEIFEETGYYIGLTLASIIPILDPKLVIISGQVAQSGDLLLKPIRSHLDRILHLRHPVPVLQAQLGDNGGLIGAAGVAFSRLGECSSRTKGV